MHKFKTTNIKGKDYVEVNQRLLYFRNEKATYIRIAATIGLTQRRTTTYNT